jgi:hypothetical protein
MQSDRAPAVCVALDAGDGETPAARGDDRDQHQRPRHPVWSLSTLPLPQQRIALASDAPRILELMRASVLELFVGCRNSNLGGCLGVRSTRGVRQ